MPEFWLVAVALASPVAGLIGFFIQLRTLKRVRLENEKLSLEIEQLRKTHEESNRIVQVARPEDTEKYSDVRFSRASRPGAGADKYDDIGPSLEKPVQDAIVQFAFWFVIVLFVLYLAYDAFRVVNRPGYPGGSWV